MKIAEFNKWFKNWGIKPNYEISQVFLTRKITLIICLAFFNLLFFQLIYRGILHFTSISNFILGCQLLLLLFLLLTIKKHFLWGVYGFFLIAISIITFLSVHLGLESQSQLFYFPIIINIIHLLNRKAFRLHLALILAFFMSGLILIIIYYANNSFIIQVTTENLSLIRLFNILMSSFATLLFLLMITYQNQKQEEQINEMLKEKDVLMAEIFHRVKNNMNIITSLINLKKNNSLSEETIDALEECRNRVFSMALVHEKIFKRKNISNLKFDEYARDLITEIRKSIGESDNDTIVLKATEMEMNINNAIPCGLILNELITNSYKHARTPGKKLQIVVELEKSGGKNKIIVSDNGPGLPNNAREKTGSLGIELIQSLCNQIDGQCQFINDNGLKFIITFN